VSRRLESGVVDEETRAAFQSVLAKLTGHDRRFDAIDRRLDAIDGRLNAHDGRLDRIEGRLNAHDGRFDGVDDRFNALDRKIDARGVMLRTETLAVGKMVAANPESIALLRRDVDDLRSRR